MIDFVERTMRRQLKKMIKLILLPISNMYELITTFILKDGDICKEYISQSQIVREDKYYMKFLCSFC